MKLIKKPNLKNCEFVERKKLTYSIWQGISGIPMPREFGIIETFINKKNFSKIHRISTNLTELNYALNCEGTRFKYTYPWLSMGYGKTNVYFNIPKEVIKLLNKPIIYIQTEDYFVE